MISCFIIETSSTSFSESLESVELSDDSVSLESVMNYRIPLIFLNH